VLSWEVMIDKSFNFLEDGKIYSMGLNAKYQLGTGDNKS
jgi:alpha-tubulin suppressor-like RCC1 family protein